MSRKGNCWDNAVAESFFHSLKTELVHHCDFATRAEAKQETFEYIEVSYNRKRRHSGKPEGVLFGKTVLSRQSAL
jgi:transposase InsO family protein